MATRTDVDLKVELDLESLGSALDDLPEVAREWGALSDGERTSWSRDWDQLMGALEYLLDPRYRSEAMTPDQRRRYQAVVGRLRAELPTIRRLNLYVPRTLPGP